MTDSIEKWVATIKSFDGETRYEVYYGPKEKEAAENSFRLDHAFEVDQIESFELTRWCDWRGK